MVLVGLSRGATNSIACSIAADMLLVGTAHSHDTVASFFFGCIRRIAEQTYTQQQFIDSKVQHVHQVMSLRREHSMTECSGNSSQDSFAAPPPPAAASSSTLHPSASLSLMRQSSESITSCPSPGGPASPVSMHSATSATFAVGSYKFSYCPICLETFSYDNPAMLLPCSHAFHAQCHISWRERSGTCCVCSATVDESKVRMMSSTDVHDRRARGGGGGAVAGIVVHAGGKESPLGTPIKAIGKPLPSPTTPQPQPAAAGNAACAAPSTLHSVRRVILTDDDDDSVDFDHHGRGGGGLVKSIRHVLSCFSCRPAAASGTGRFGANRGTAVSSTASLRAREVPLRGPTRAVADHATPTTAARSGGGPLNAYEVQERKMAAQKALRHV